MSSSHWVLLLVFFPFVSSCRKDDIEVFRVPKEITESALSLPSAAADSQQDIEWKVPTTWKSQAPSEMRVGSFLVTGKEGQQADISVIPLSGEAGGMLDNINRWRQQINLPPLAGSDLEGSTKIISPAGRRMSYVNIVSTESLIEGKHKKRIIAAIYEQAGRTWFFKMSGDDETVKAAEPDFMAFLKSLKFKTDK